jgi:hypothetical protein
MGAAEGNEERVQQGTTDRIGAVLRTVRESRGLTLEDACRDTRIRREFLEAIEGDDFDRLLGDVHARGCLRTYASYLRLSPDKVVSAYAGTGAEPPAPAPYPAPETVLARRRHRDNHRLVVLVAATLLAVAAAFGVLSARESAPPPAEPATGDDVTSATVLARGITVAIAARRPVEVTITADDGPPRTYTLAAGEGRSFDGDRAVTVELSEGGTARLTVNGRDYGFPGAPELPWRRTFDFGASPSP